MIRATAVALVMFVAAACAQENEMSASVEEVQARHTDELMATPGVVSVGIVLLNGLDESTGASSIERSGLRSRPSMESIDPD